MEEARDIELGPTLYDKDFLSYQVQSERHQVMPDGNWIRACRRVTGLDDLFVYHHTETGNFVLSQWIHSPDQVTRPIINEIQTMDLAPDRGGWIPLRMVELRCQPQYVLARQIREDIVRKRSERESEKADNLEERNSTKKWLKQQGHETAAALVDRGGYGGKSEGRDAMTEELIDATKNRVYSYDGTTGDR